LTAVLYSTKIASTLPRTNPSTDSMLTLLRYILLDKQLIDISNIAINRPDMKGEHDIFNRVMPRDHIAVVAFLENRATGTRLIVVNAHVFWDPAFTDVKIVQVAILMEQISKMAEKYAKWPACTDKSIYKYTNGDSEDADEDQEEAPEPAPSVEYPDKLSIPLLVCGDFNSTPDSGVCELIGHGSLPNNHAALGNRKYGDFTRNGMAHPFSLKSAYSPSDLPFTNYTPGFVGILEYIWYSTNSLQVTKLLGPIDENYLQRVPGFPNYHFPSDHIALKAEFYVKGMKKTTDADFGSQSNHRRPTPGSHQ
jgi:CCR4-NOT transcription complex subunit 6